jgi:hypothetical protein
VFLTRTRLLLTSVCVTIAGVSAGLDVDLRIPPEHPAIGYFKQSPDDAVIRLAKRIDKGEVKLDYDPAHLGYLPSLLKNLNINADSQLLVFSKTSFQAPLISPRSPRAIFFSDSVSVGSVHGGEVMELAALDPRQGVVFYTLSVARAAKPKFVRRDDCLQCHQGPATLGVPGLEVGSSFPGPEGAPVFRLGFTAIDHRIPLAQRWGGWYVTGTTGNQTHLGNAIAGDPDNPRHLDTTNTVNLTSLTGRFDTTAYLQPTSDVVALMVLEHQTRMTNLMIRVGWETRVAQYDASRTNRIPDAAAATRTEEGIDELVAYMLFAEETPLTDRAEGVSTFTRTFAQRGPRDKQGRSLRDFDLQTRMFRYPLSYMIYSEALDGLPDWARDRVYRRLYDVLTRKDTSERYARLSAEDRRAVLEIVRDTKRGLPDYWR